MPVPYYGNPLKNRKRCNEKTAQSAAASPDVKELKEKYVKDFIKTAHTYPYRACSTPYMELLPCLQGNCRPPALSPYFDRPPSPRATSVETIAPILPLWNFMHGAKQTKSTLNIVEWLLFDTSAREYAWADCRTREKLLTSTFFKALHNAWAHFGYRHHVFCTETAFDFVDLYHDADVEPQPLPEWLLLDNACARGSIDDWDRESYINRLLESNQQMFMGR